MRENPRETDLFRHIGDLSYQVYIILCQDNLHVYIGREILWLVYQKIIILNAVTSSWINKSRCEFRVDHWNLLTTFSSKINLKEMHLSKTSKAVEWLLKLYTIYTLYNLSSSFIYFTLFYIVCIWIMSPQPIRATNLICTRRKFLCHMSDRLMRLLNQVSISNRIIVILFLVNF